MSDVTKPAPSSPAPAEDAEREIVKLIETVSENINSSETFQDGLSLLRKPGVTDKLEDAIRKWSNNLEKFEILEKVLKQLAAVFEKIHTQNSELIRDLRWKAVNSGIIAIGATPLVGSDLHEKYIRLQKLFGEKKGPLVKGSADGSFDKMIPPEDFRTISIIPTLEELVANPKPFLRPNKINGPYNDSEHYLDVQFRLLREDFLQPLRQIVHEFRQNPRKFQQSAGRKKLKSGQNSGVRCYRDVTFSSVENNGKDRIFNLPERFAKNIDWSRSKKLRPGNLVMLTCDSLKTAIFATVANLPFDSRRKQENVREDPRVTELSQGKLRLKVETGEHLISKSTSRPYLMFECEGFFEAYRYNLAILQTIRRNCDQFNRLYGHIIKPSSDIGLPVYLENTDKSLRLPPVLHLEDQPDSPPLPPRAPETWDSDLIRSQVGLDPDQYNAWKTAITSELSVIQGPPGTGKTYVGLQIVRTLLCNKEAGLVPDFPFLIVCYTNHALDQFLELLLRETPNLNLARIGGQCKSPILEPHSLANNRQKPSAGRKDPEEWEARKAEKFDAWDHVDRLTISVDKVESEIFNLKHQSGMVNFRGLSVSKTLEKILPECLWAHLGTMEWLAFRNDTFEVDDFNVSEIVNRLFAIEPDASSLTRQFANLKNGDEDAEDAVWMGSDPLTYDGTTFARMYSIQECALAVTRYKEKLQNLVSKYQMLACDEKLSEEEIHTRFPRMLVIQKEIQDTLFNLNAARNRGKLFATIFGLYNKDKLILPDLSKVFFEKNGFYFTSSNDIKRYPLRIRWALYFAIVQVALKLTEKHLPAVRNQLNFANAKFAEARNQLDGVMLKGVDIIGMTTTGAAKMHDLLIMASPCIVIVEEAAEIFEAHIVTALTKKCNQLILIGDHQQLRPSPNVYELEREYNLDISLFERLIFNGVPLCTLKTQHRMRPEISDLIIGPIYKELHDHPKVQEYPRVRGVTKRMFFINHSEREESNDDILSKSNYHEAVFLLALCEYLLEQDYNPSRITILTTYTGQVLQFRRILPPSCYGVRVTCVDSYQGEENDIVLLSLVRSNESNKVGFVGIDNRICVALSRARHGFFIIGNMDVLERAKKTWRAILRKLENGGNIGPELELVCERHGNTVKVSREEHFENVRENGGCGQPCKTTLKCGHVCEKQCHGRDPEHERMKCRQKCKNACKRDHQCDKACFECNEHGRCPPCKHLVEVDLKCGHQAKMFCFQDPDAILCKELVDKPLPCTHTVPVQCHVFETSAKVTCRSEVLKILPCGHSQTVKCFIDTSHVKCTKAVPKSLRCGHQVVVECYKSSDFAPCTTLVEKTLSCGHSQKSVCGKTVKCEVPVPEVNPACSHTSNRPCHQSGLSTCLELCGKTLNCGHTCPQRCHIGKDPEHLEFKCKATCTKTCDSGHPCKFKHSCHSTCYPCETLVAVTLLCGHVIQQVKCSEAKKDHRCPIKVAKILPCGHEQRVPCSRGASLPKCKTSIICLKTCSSGHPCGFEHACSEECPPCMELGEEQGLTCGHKAFVPCSVATTQYKCLQLIPFKLTCGHEQVIMCHQRRTSAMKKSNLEKCVEPLEVLCSKCQSKMTIKCFEKRIKRMCDTCYLRSRSGNRGKQTEDMS